MYPPGDGLEVAAALVLIDQREAAVQVALQGLEFAFAGAVGGAPGALIAGDLAASVEQEHVPPLGEEELIVGVRPAVAETCIDVAARAIGVVAVVEERQVQRVAADAENRHAHADLAGGCVCRYGRALRRRSPAILLTFATTIVAATTLAAGRIGMHVSRRYRAGHGKQQQTTEKQKAVKDSGVALHGLILRWAPVLISWDGLEPCSAPGRCWLRLGHSCLRLRPRASSGNPASNSKAVGDRGTSARDSESTCRAKK